MPTESIPLKDMLIREKREVEGRIRALGNFLYASGDAAKDVSWEERDLMVRRLTAMQQYSRALQKHITHLELCEVLDIKRGKTWKADAVISVDGALSAEEFAATRELIDKQVSDRLARALPEMTFGPLDDPADGPAAKLFKQMKKAEASLYKLATMYGGVTEAEEDIRKLKATMEGLVEIERREKAAKDAVDLKSVLLSITAVRTDVYDFATRYGIDVKSVIGLVTEGLRDKGAKYASS